MRFEFVVCGSSDGVDVYDLLTGTNQRAVNLSKISNVVTTFFDEKGMKCAKSITDILCSYLLHILHLYIFVKGNGFFVTLSSEKPTLAIHSWNSGLLHVKCSLPEHVTAVSVSPDGVFMCGGVCALIALNMHGEGESCFFLSLLTFFLT